MKKLSISALALALLLSSCGGSSETTNEDVPTVKEEQVEVQEEKVEEVNTEAIAVDGKLEITSDDQMQYNKTVLKVKEGEEITLTLTHTGAFPKATMGHNLVILKQGVDIEAFTELSMDAVDTDYIPEGDDIVAHTGLIGGGESSSVTFTAPEKGTYDFICTFPGHYGVMNGKFIVE